MATAHLPLPVWIWHPDKVARLTARLLRRFELERDLESPVLGLAVTGGTRVLMDGVEILRLPERPENVCRFTYAESIALGAGSHCIEIEIECRSPMPEHEAISFARDRTVGCIAWLEDDGFRLVTDRTWSADDGAAVEVCKLGQEPYGDLDNPPEDFARSGFGDLLSTPMLVTVVGGKNTDYRQQAAVLRLFGRIESAVTIERPARGDHSPIYHLRKQEDWKKLRKIQRKTDLNEVPKVLLDLQHESNARLRIHNLGPEQVTVLWNGAESLHEFEYSDGCITEAMEVGPGKVSSSVPVGMRYVAMFILSGTATPFELDVVCESVVAELEQVGTFRSDDDQINRIYETSVHTNRLCHQLALWDGIKRDRLPWVYDLYLAARGAYPIWSHFPVLRRSLAELGDTPEGSWMNGVPDYTLWWFVSIWEYLLHRSDAGFAEKLAPAIQRHADWVGSNVDENGFLKAERAFIDWVPMTEEERRLSLQAIYLIARESLCNMKDVMPHLELTFNWPVPDIQEERYLNASPVIAKVLGILAGYMSTEKALDFLRSYELKDPVSPCSAYLLACLYADFDMPERGLSIIRSLWGGMLDRGATSFWEAVRCNYPDDFHKHLTTYTGYGEYRMSLCHAWSSTPVDWFARTLLGVNPVSPGYREVEIAIWAPENMKKCEGSVSTPFGQIRVSWVRKADGEIIVKTEIPEGVRVV